VRGAIKRIEMRGAAIILRIDPMALLYVATVLAQRLDSAIGGSLS
jgi:hypothetical protein